MVIVCVFGGGPNTFLHSYPEEKNLVSVGFKRGELVSHVRQTESDAFLQKGIRQLNGCFNKKQHIFQIAENV